MKMLAAERESEVKYLQNELIKIKQHRVESDTKFIIDEVHE